MNQHFTTLLHGLRRIVAHARQAQFQPRFAKDQAWEIEQLATDHPGGWRVVT